MCVCVMHSVLVFVIHLLCGRFSLRDDGWSVKARDELCCYACVYNSFEFHTWWNSCGVFIDAFRQCHGERLCGGCQNQCISQEWSCGHAERHRGFQTAHETVFDPEWNSLGEHTLHTDDSSPLAPADSLSSAVCRSVVYHNKGKPAWHLGTQHIERIS